MKRLVAVLAVALVAVAISAGSASAAPDQLIVSGATGTLRTVDATTGVVTNLALKYGNVLVQGTDGSTKDIIQSGPQTTAVGLAGLPVNLFSLTSKSLCLSVQGNVAVNWTVITNDVVTLNPAVFPQSRVPFHKGDILLQQVVGNGAAPGSVQTFPFSSIPQAGSTTTTIGLLALFDPNPLGVGLGTPTKGCQQISQYPNPFVIPGVYSGPISGLLFNPAQNPPTVTTGISTRDGGPAPTAPAQFTIGEAKLKRSTGVMSMKGTLAAGKTGSVKVMYRVRVNNKRNTFSTTVTAAADGSFSASIRVPQSVVKAAKREGRRGMAMAAKDASIVQRGVEVSN